jgi:hypothetical protein
VTYSKTLLLPALLAAGSGLGTTPAAALELGDLRVESTLGQPLRASIAYALAPHEELAPYCISLAPAVSLDALPTLRNAEISLTADRIVLAGAAAMREPMLALRLDIDCPYTPKLLHEYVAFVDPAMDVAAPAPAVARAPEPVQQPAATPATQTAVARTVALPDATPETVRAPDSGARYHVQRGDNLSTIAQRLDRGGMPLWDAVDLLFAANPAAFIDEDPNLLKTGVWLVIPDFGQAEVADFVQSAASMPAPVVDAPAETPAVEGANSGALPPVPESVPAASEFADLRPGDPVVEDRVQPSAKPRDASAPGTSTGAAETAATTPVTGITTATAAPQAADRSLWWMIGGGALLLGGLLYFAARERFGRRRRTAEDEPEYPHRRSTDVMPHELPVLAPIVADDYELDDDSPTSENLILDADLEAGTGLGGGSDILVAEDFGFDTSADLDFELPDETGLTEDEPETDIIPPPKVESTILEREVLPENDDYDMSVILDVTKVPDPIAVTERDLKAVVIGSADDTEIAGAYTVSQEVDYQVLEQDYEDELTATQALNLEIEKAAAELANRLDAEIRAERDGAMDAANSLANVTAFSPLYAGNDDDAGNTDVTESLESVSYLDDDARTARLPAADDDVLDDDTIGTEQLDSGAR